MAIWPLFLIALYWSSQNGVETERLPNKHLEEAIECAREFLKEDVVSPPFRHLLTYGEYLGDLCKDDIVEIIGKKLKNYAPEGGQKVEECLAKKNLSHVYIKIRDHGSEKLAEAEKRGKLQKEFMPSEESQQMSSFQPRSLEEDMNDDIYDNSPSLTTTGKNDDKVATPKTPQSPTFEETQSADVKLAQFPTETGGSPTFEQIQSADVKLAQSPTGTGVSGVHESPKIIREEKYSEEINLENVPDLSKYIIGLCMIDESVDFEKLENDQDKVDALDCLETCSTNFMMKIENQFTNAKSKIGQIMSDIQQKFLDDMANSLEATETAISKEEADSELKLLSEQYKEMINEFYEQTRIEKPAISIYEGLSFKKPKISAEGDKPASSKRIIDIGEITKARIPFMNRYSHVYSILTKRLGEIDIIKLDEDSVLDFKEQLEASRNNEESLNSCLRLSFIQYKSCAKVECYMKAPKSVPLYEFIFKKASMLESYREEEELETSATSELKFYAALTRGENYDNDSDSDDDDDSLRAAIQD